MDENCPAWVRDHHKNLMDLYDRVDEMESEPLSTEEMCRILVEISNMKSAMGMVYDKMANVVTTLLQDETIVNLDEGHVVEKKWSKPRKAWQHKELGAVVADRIHRMAVDMDTGEVVLSQTEMIEKMLEFVQPSYWRITSLESIGINADDYCETGESKPSLKITKAKG